MAAATISAQAEQYLAGAEDYVRDRDFPVYSLHVHNARRLRLSARLRGQWDEAATRLIAELIDERGNPGMIGRESVPFLARIRVRQGHADATPLLDLGRNHARGRADALEWTVPVGLACIEHAWLTGEPDGRSPVSNRAAPRADRPGRDARPAR